jgi:3-hydroxyacyl-CoA dehydrogenase
MPDGARETIAIVGAGLIGTSWAALFAFAGHRVLVHDQDEAARLAAPARVHAALAELTSLHGQRGSIGEVAVTQTLEEAAISAAIIQECIREDLAAKQALYRQLRPLAPAAIIASSTSTFLPSALFGGLPNAEACLTAHPLLPPHLIPVSELVPAPFTGPDTLQVMDRVLTGAGHKVIHLAQEMPGFVLNRLQFAVLGEAMHLVDSGICEPDAIDLALRHGLGLRWASIGMFANSHLNAAGGIEGSFSSYRAALEPVLQDLKPAHPWSDGLISQIGTAMRRCVPEDRIPAERQERDARIAALRRQLIQLEASPPAGP